MIERGPIVAEIPRHLRQEGIRWLVLEFDSSSRGWFVCLHKTLDRPCTYDNWYQTRDDALRDSERSWGVRPEDWRDRDMVIESPD